MEEWLLVSGVVTLTYMEEWLLVSGALCGG